jgi:hypothetical protein
MATPMTEAMQPDATALLQTGAEQLKSPSVKATAPAVGQAAVNVAEVSSATMVTG